VLDRFTDTAKRLITLARERAEERQHDSLSNEHLLEVLLEAPDCLAYKLIMTQMPCMEFVNKELILRLESIEKNPQAGINFDDSCKKTFEKVFLLTDKLGHTRISTGSLILGMLQSETTSTVKLLQSWGLSIKGVLEALTEEGDPGEDETDNAEMPAEIINQIERISEIDDDSLRIIAHSQELAKSCHSAEVNAHHFLLSLVFLASRDIIDMAFFDVSTLDLAKIKELVAPNLKGELEYKNNHLVFELLLHKVFRIAALEAFEANRSQTSPIDLILALLRVIPDEATAGLKCDYYSLKWRVIDQTDPASLQETIRHKAASSTLTPRISLRRYNADQSIVILIPEKFAREWQVMAIDSRDSILTVAMVDPFDKDTIKNIEELTGLSVAVIKADAKDLYAAFRINY